MSRKWLERSAAWLAVVALTLTATVGAMLSPRPAEAVSFTQVQNVSQTDNQNSQNPSVALDGSGGIHVVWFENGEIYYSTNRNTNWPAVAQVVGVVTTDPAKLREIETDDLGTGNSGGPGIAADGDNVHIIWSNADSGQIMYARYNSSGARTLGPVSIGGGNVPRVASRGNTVAAVWQQSDLSVHYRESNNLGASWGGEQTINAGRNTAFGQVVEIDSAGIPHVAWGGQDRQVYSTEHTGGSWQGVSSRGGGFWPHLASDNSGAVFLVYQGTDADIHFRRWAGGWGGDVKINSSGGASFYPSLAWDFSTNLLHAVWQEASSSGFNIYYSSSGDNGNSWSSMENASIHTGSKDVSADLKAMNGNLNLVEAEASPGHPYDVWFQCTTCNNGVGGGAGWAGGNTVVGTESPATLWYFAEGYTGTGFDEYLTLGNPGSSPANVTVSYYLGNGSVLGKPYQVPGHSRYTIFVNNEVGADKQVSLKVESTQPIVAERPMYFTYGDQNWNDGSVTMGAKALSTTWYFAEGFTGNGFQEYLIVFNPGDSSTRATVTYMLENGTTSTKNYDIPGKSRANIYVNTEIGTGHAVSARVDATQPVVAERSMYFDFNGWSGGHVVMGATAPSSLWYFAEGYTAPGFQEYLTLQNPNQSTATATLTYMMENGAYLTKQYNLGGNSRTTIDVNQDVGANQPVSTRVQSSQPIVAERPMYFNFNGWTGGSVVMGALNTSTIWYFAEGWTGSGFQEYFTLQNPGSTSTVVTINYLKADGSTVGRTYPLTGNSRRTVDVNVEVGADQAVSAIVQAGQPIVVERPMYFNYHHQ